MSKTESFVSNLCKVRQKATRIVTGYCEDDCGENCGTMQDS